MTHLATTPLALLCEVPPFNQLSPEALAQLAKSMQLYRHQIGQTIALRDRMPSTISIIWKGQVRLLGIDPITQKTVTLKLLQPGEILGWVSVVRNAACESMIASTEVVCLSLSTMEFLNLVKREQVVREFFRDQLSIAELYDVLCIALQDQADQHQIFASLQVNSLKDLALKILPRCVVHVLPNLSLPLDYQWFVSNRNKQGFEIGAPFDPKQFRTKGLRIIGIPENILTGEYSPTVETDVADAPPELEDNSPQSQRYPVVRGHGAVNSALACFEMLAQYWNIPLCKETIQRVLMNQKERTGTISLLHCGAIAELMGLRSQFIEVPIAAISRIQTPALIPWNESFAVIYAVNSKHVTLAIPELGLVQRNPTDLPSQEGSLIPVLLLQPTQETPQKKFGLSWFLPSLNKYKGVLLEVFAASFFVQLFGLANPLMTQVIIDRVLVQNSPNTLQILGIFLVLIAIFEAILTSLRTYLFVDTTNRIDLALGSEIIDHLLRLPLRYFDKRPVGELATRVNELENIRQFLTGTALTVVLDAVFSLIYIVVMVLYSGLLTAVALVTLPFFVLLTVFVSPLVRRQLRTKAERNAQTQSFLVEVLSGIPTVKAQNIELRSRWKWQERYASYVTAGFKTVLTYTAASSTSTFLNQLSGLLVLWVGAYLVLDGKLTLGQLIAFRIIAGYVTSPLLRLTQIWQNFQETALSLERLSDILDTPTEAEDLNNIPMPVIAGKVQFENVSFRFNPGTPLQLRNINLTIEPGQFIGIVGQSGSGKSTLMKLLPRLYPLESGRILIDAYDVSKVDLYSLRRQIGIVPQDALLFEGTVEENIALNHPDATSDEIINAAKIAVAHEFIMNLPNGYNTYVGERGASLSGEQRQRIAIARTVLQNPHLLILDEATSALDYNAERQVGANLAAAFRGRTVFFITHRLSSIRSADRILLMDQGEIVEQGTHGELMALRGRYYCLYLQQEAAA